MYWDFVSTSIKATEIFLHLDYSSMLQSYCSTTSTGDDINTLAYGFTSKRNEKYSWQEHVQCADTVMVTPGVGGDCKGKCDHHSQETAAGGRWSAVGVIQEGNLLPLNPQT